MGRGPLSSARGTGSERQVGGAAEAEGSGGEEICFLGCWMCEREWQGGSGLGKSQPAWEGFENWNKSLTFGLLAAGSQQGCPAVVSLFPGEIAHLTPAP